MKTKKFIALVVLVSGGLFFFSSCDEESTTEYIEKIYGCTNSSAINYNANATDDDGSCITDDQLDDTTRVVYSAAEHTADANLKPWIDQTHSNLMWETDYKDAGLSTLTGRFVDFDGNLTFNEKDPSLINFSGWSQISTNFTGEDGRDNPNTGCMPRDLGVRWYTHEEISGTDTTIVQDSIIPNSDFAYLETKAGQCEFYYTTNKRGFTSSYRVPATLQFKEQSTATNDGPLFESDVMVYFNYNGWDYANKRSGISGYFEFDAKGDHGVASTSIGEKVTIKFNMQIRF